MQLEQDLPVVRDVRRNTEDDSNFFQLNSGARNVVSALCALLSTLRAEIENADRNFLTNENLGLAIVESDDAWLSLQICEAYFLECVEEAGKLEFSERGREHELESRVHDTRI